jgi:hypothetical protein
MTAKFTPAVMQHHLGILRRQGIAMNLDESQLGNARQSLWLEETNPAGELCRLECWYRRKGGRWSYWKMLLFVNGEEIDIMGKLSNALRVLGRTNPDEPLPGRPAAAKSRQTLQTKKNTVIRV